MAFLQAVARGGPMSVRIWSSRLLGGRPGGRLQSRLGRWPSERLMRVWSNIDIVFGILLCCCGYCCCYCLGQWSYSACRSYMLTSYDNIISAKRRNPLYVLTACFSSVSLVCFSTIRALASNRICNHPPQKKWNSTLRSPLTVSQNMFQRA